MYGIDISKHNGNINLKPYKKNFVIIRVGYGRFTLDSMFKRNVSECKRLGIPFGVYFYSYALNVAQARAEAKAVLHAIKPYKHDIKVGVWFDMEDADGFKSKHGFKFTSANIGGICKAFCDEISKSGYYAGIYTASSWLHHLKGTCDRYDKWVASWGKDNGKQTTNTKAHGTLQQYTSKPFDKDIMYVDISHYSKGRKAQSKTGKPEKTSGKASKLAVDGSLGTASVKALQKWLGTTVDGVISGQAESNKKYMSACNNSAWQFTSHANKSEKPTGSQAIKALQKKLGVTADGIMGQVTIKALQKYLKVKVDGYLGADTAKALQRYLNNR